MDERRKPLEIEEIPYKKKAKSKKRVRSDHKHEYKTILLYHFYESNVFPGKNGYTVAPTRVCQICGRVGYVDMDQYDHVEVEDDLPYKIKKRVVRDEDKLEKWYVASFFDKFAHKLEGDLPDGTIYHW